MTNREIKQKFVDQNLHSLWDRVKFWFFIRRVYWAKRMGIWEGYLDKMYFETNYLDEINYNEIPDRQELQNENRKPFKDQDVTKIASLEEKISRAKAIKESYRRNAVFLEDTSRYKEMLDIWFRDPMESTYTYWNQSDDERL